MSLFIRLRHVNARYTAEVLSKALSPLHLNHLFSSEKKMGEVGRIKVNNNYF